MDDAYHYMSCQYHRGWALLHGGELGAALAALEDGLEVAERNDNRAWSRVFRFGLAWVHAEAFDFEGARALCEPALAGAREPLLGQFLGLIVLGAAHLGRGRLDAALEALTTVTRQLDDDNVLMDWILRMPLGRALADHALAQGERSRARHEAERLAQLASRPPERTYLALARSLLAEVALLESSLPRAEAELATALAATEGVEVPLAAWRVHDTAARLHAARHDAMTAKRHRARSAAVLTRLADSLRDRPALQRALLDAPRVQAALA
jgi:tetratricopeptide (TPR) repeat protein